MKSIQFGIVTVVLCGIAVLLARIQVNSWEYRVRVLDAQEETIGAEIVQLRNAMDAMRDLETGQRGFLLTGDEAYLAPYERGLTDLSPALTALANDFRETPSLVAEVAELANIAEAKKRELAETIRLRRDSGLAAAVAVVKTGEGQRLMDTFRERARRILGLLRQERLGLYAEQTRIFERLSSLGGLVVGLIMLLVGVAIGWLIVSMRRLDQLQRQREAEAMHDALTGLPNRRYLREWLEPVLARAGRGQRSVILLYFDLDGFKAVNDRFGHDAGDRVLQVTATRLRDTLRGSDFIARLGGDEFVAVLPDASAQTALPELLLRLQANLAKAPLPELADGAVSASIGVASFPADAETADALLSAADRAMYAAKQTRRRGGVDPPERAAAAPEHTPEAATQ